MEATSSNASIELILLQLIAELYRYRDMEKEWYHWDSVQSAFYKANGDELNSRSAKAGLSPDHLRIE